MAEEKSENIDEVKETVVTPEPAQEPAPAPVPPAPVNPPVTSATNGLAIASMVVGIVAFISGYIPFWGLLVGVAAVVLGIIALKKPNGKGMSIAGIVTGGLAALTSIIFTGLFIVALASSGAMYNEAKEQANKQEAESQQLLDAKKDFAKGETAVFGTLEVKANSVQRDYVPDTTYYYAEEGNEYVVVNVTIKNIGDESEYVSDFSFSLNDSGMAEGSSFLTVDPELEAGNLSPGAEVTGNIVYEVTKGSTDLKLQYETTYYTPTYESKNLVYTLAI